MRLPEGVLTGPIPIAKLPFLALDTLRLFSSFFHLSSSSGDRLSEGSELP